MCVESPVAKTAGPVQSKVDTVHTMLVQPTDTQGQGKAMLRCFASETQVNRGQHHWRTTRQHRVQATTLINGNSVLVHMCVWTMCGSEGYLIDGASSSSQSACNNSQASS